MLLYSSQRTVASILSLVAGLAAPGCINQVPGGDPIDEDSQGLVLIIDDGPTDFSFSDTYQDFDFGNLDSLVQFEIAADPSEEVVVTATRLQADPVIEALDLSTRTADIAYELKGRYPSIEFSSGRRDVKKQAHAMAANVAKNRQYIAGTYPDSALSRA